MNLTTERINVILDFIEKNAQNFNEGDYMESLNLVAQKLELEFGRPLGRRPAIKILNDFVLENFQKLSGPMTNTFLHYVSTLAARDLRILNRELSQNLVQRCLSNLEKNHANMNLNQILNNVTMIGLLSNVNPNIYLKEREGELASLSLGQIMRIAKRISIPNQSNVVRASVSRFIVNELVNKASTERPISKARILNTLCRIDSIDPLLNISPKIRTMIKSIREDLEQFDTASILQITEAMIYCEDFSKNDLLREINDVVFMTVTHNADNIYPDFFVRYLENHAKIRTDSGITHDHLKVFLEFYLKNKKPEEIRNARNLMNIFHIMKKCRFYEKDILEQFYDLTLNVIPIYPIDENLFSYRFLVTNHLGETHLNKVQELVQTEVTNIMSDTSKRDNTILMLNNFAKLCFFHSKPEIIENCYITLKASLKASSFKNFIKILEVYIENVQEHLKPQYRDGLVEEIIARIDLEAENIQLSKLYIYLNECLISRENEELKKKIASYTQIISEKPIFKNSFIRSFENQTNINNRFMPITNLSFSKYLYLLRESIKDQEFILTKEKTIILNILQTAYNIVKQNKGESNISDDLLTSFFRIGNEIVIKYPNALISLNPNRLSSFIKAFNSEDYESPLFEKLAFASLNSISAERLERDISNDIIVLLEKLSRNEKTPEKIELIKKVLGDEEKIKNSLENSSIFTSIYKLLTSLNKLDNQQLISDELLIWGKNLLINKLKDENYNLNNKLNILYALSNARTSIITENDINNISDDIKNIFFEFSIKRLIRTLNSSPMNINRGTLSRKLHLEYSNLYEADQTPNKLLALRTLDRFTQIKWPMNNIYNKFISDYDKLFDKFSSVDHAHVINYLSRVNINKEDIINAASKAINLQALSENEKLTLFKSYVKLGFYKGEKKIALFDNIFSTIDITHLIRKQPTVGKIQLLLTAWKLSSTGLEVKGFVSLFYFFLKINFFLLIKIINNRLILSLKTFQKSL